MKRFQSHKVVVAAKIRGVGKRNDGRYFLTLEDDGFEYEVTAAWLARHAPEEVAGNLVGGYLVEYDEAEYVSWSPAQPFEAGYTELVKTTELTSAELPPAARGPVTSAQHELIKRVDRDFTYHAPVDDLQRELYEGIRDTARAFATFLVLAVPLGRELSRSLSDLEDVVMHANSGVARHWVSEKEPTDG